VKKLHDYLRANAMKILMPTEHKYYVRRIFVQISSEFLTQEVSTEMDLFPDGF
jgi:hypothetical protein